MDSNDRIATTVLHTKPCHITKIFKVCSITNLSNLTEKVTQDITHWDAAKMCIQRKKY